MDSSPGEQSQPTLYSELCTLCIYHQTTEPTKDLKIYKPKELTDVHKIVTEQLLKQKGEVFVPLKDCWHKIPLYL